MNAFNRNPSTSAARKAALQALSFDAAKDITSAACVPSGAACTARIIAKSDFVLCGIVEADAVFRSRKVKAGWKFKEGQKVKKGSAVSFLSGNCRAILACERTALNYLSFLSGIATRSSEASKKYGKWKIAATRKVLPNLSDSQKRAVLVGGCLAHRLNLADGILIKDNHMAAIIRMRKCGKGKAIALALSSFPRSSFVEVEVSSVSEAVAAVEAGAKAILADNVSPAALRSIARAARKAKRSIIIEASGGITLAAAGRYLKAGADFVSASELTMKIEPADLSLEIDF